MPATSTSVTGPSELMNRRVLAMARGAALPGMGGRKAAARAGRARSTAMVRMVLVELGWGGGWLWGVCGVWGWSGLGGAVCV